MRWIRVDYDVVVCVFLRSACVRVCFLQHRLVRGSCDASSLHPSSSSSSSLFIDIAVGGGDSLGSISIINYCRCSSMIFHFASFFQFPSSSFGSVDVPLSPPVRIGYDANQNQMMLLLLLLIF